MWNAGEGSREPTSLPCASASLQVGFGDYGGGWNLHFIGIAEPLADELVEEPESEQTSCKFGGPAHSGGLYKFFGSFLV